MNTLGIGARVWIGWTPAVCCTGPSERARLKTGTIIKGPAEPWQLVTPDGKLNRFRMWMVQPDGAAVVWAAEELLSPIDDGEDAVLRSTDRKQPEPTHVELVDRAIRYLFGARA